jgi:hypothetical protein
MTNNGSGNFPISPTTPESLFGIYVQFLSAERQLIWDRFSAMLVANTIILNALTNTYKGWKYTDKLRNDAVNCFR